MASTKTLLEVSYHDDDDTGMYQVGKIDFGIVGTLDDYLKNYGYAGKKDIIDTLGYLIYEVEKRFREQNSISFEPTHEANILRETSTGFVTDEFIPIKSPKTGKLEIIPKGKPKPKSPTLKN